MVGFDGPSGLHTVALDAHNETVTVDLTELDASGAPGYRCAPRPYPHPYTYT